MLRRPRRNRKSQAIRNMVEETRLSVKDFIFPMFLIDGVNQKVEVASMPGIYRYSLDLMLKEIEECANLGIMAFDIFPAYPESKKISTLLKAIIRKLFTFRPSIKSRLLFRKL